MRVIRARNVQQIIPEAMYQLLHGVGHVKQETRNGPVVMFEEPVTSVYERPAERVIFWPKRDANPFFHLVESLWMLAGLNDVESVARYAANIRNYSDNGKTFRGAYGHRWRKHWGYDQLDAIIQNLRYKPNCRRQVLSIWDAKLDLFPMKYVPEFRDLPCNLVAVFQITNSGRLDMMVTNRSNDLVWGAYGANAVHFSYLHEYIARQVGVEQGVYRQVSANLHVYEATLEKVESLADWAQNPLLGVTTHPIPDPYQAGEVKPFPLINGDPKDWEDDLRMFWSVGEVIGYKDVFFRRVAAPMVQAHTAFKQKENPDRFAEALDILQEVKATDWQKAAIEWIQRREVNYQKKQPSERAKRAQDDGVFYE